MGMTFNNVTLQGGAPNSEVTAYLGWSLAKTFYVLQKEQTKKLPSVERGTSQDKWAWCLHMLH